VTLRRDEVSVERRAVEPGTITSGAPFMLEGALHVPIVEEEIVVQTRTVIREVLVIRKQVVEETTQARADLRKERVEVERTDEGAPAAGRR